MILCGPTIVGLLFVDGKIKKNYHNAILIFENEETCRPKKEKAGTLALE